MKPHDDKTTRTIAFRAHPPERLVRSLARGHIAGGCCCCCCCLHSLGSLAGAVLGSFFPSERPSAGAMPASAKLRDDELDGPARNAPARSAANTIYWLVTLGVLVLASMFAIARGGSFDATSALFVLAIFLPALQLAASLISLLIFVSVPELRQDSRIWKRLGFVTLWSIGGCLLGLLIMYVIATSHR
jgi:hypothetical protein